MGGSRSGATWFAFTLLAYGGQILLSSIDASIPMLLQSANLPFLQPALWMAGTSVIFISLLVLLGANARLSQSLYSSQQKFEELAHTDVTTGLYNRRYFELRMSSLIDSEGNKQSPFSLFYFDLNNFKAINDSHGHQVGDLMLKHAGHLLRMTFRTSDSIFRMGGDEFAVIVEADLTDSAANRLLEELNKACHDPLIVAGKPIKVSSSTGIAYFPKDGVDMDTLLTTADSAMYAEKLQFRRSNSL
ncbi:MAG: GGDEF domain-containing protein, partial [Pseudomonadales bacterium]